MLLMVAILPGTVPAGDHAGGPTMAAAKGAVLAGYRQRKLRSLGSPCLGVCLCRLS